MTQHNSISATQLLSAEDKAVCTLLKDQDNSDTGQRAAALLLINDGATQAEAAEKSGLSIGQIRYLVKRFKEKGIEMFPAELLTEPPVANVTEVEEADVPTPSPEATETEEPQEIIEPQPTSAEPEVEKPVKKKKNRNNKKSSKKRIKKPKPVKKKKKSKRKRKNKK